MMKKTLIMLLFSFAFLIGNAQDKNQTSSKPDPNKKIQLVEASCGQCKFGLKGKGCDLAVRVNNKAYFVDGTDIDSHGDAHAEHGFCKSIRKAKVQGEVVNNKFKLSYFELLPEPAKAN